MSKAVTALTTNASARERARFYEMVNRVGLPALRSAIAERIERDIALLDLLDRDVDLEPDECAELFVQPEIRGGASVRAF